MNEQLWLYLPALLAQLASALPAHPVLQTTTSNVQLLPAAQKSYPVDTTTPQTGSICKRCIIAAAAAAGNCMRTKKACLGRWHFEHGPLSSLTPNKSTLFAIRRLHSLIFARCSAFHGQGTALVVFAAQQMMLLCRCTGSIQPQRTQACNVVVRMHVCGSGL
jgi:hypothetical protein